MNVRHFILFFFLLSFLPLVAQQKSSEKPFVVVIDAGHGGHDPGAVGKLEQEKKLNLDVTLRLGKMIEESYSDVKVYYTRKTDIFLPLQDRANFVNKHNADLFICIHTNAASSSAAVGAETFVLGIDKMSSNLSVAKRENSVILLEDNYETTYQGFDPNSIDSYIMFELMQDQYIDQSVQFADLVQQQFSGKLKRADRGVRQAGFWVLHKSACPSVLVEMGFISNPEEERYLVSEEGKKAISGAIFTAFVSYKASIDKKNGRPVVMPEVPELAPIVVDNKPVENAEVSACYTADKAAADKDAAGEKKAEKKAAEKASEKAANEVEEQTTESTAEELAAIEKAAAEKKAAEKAAAEKRAAEKAAAEKAAAEKWAAEKKAAEKKAAEKVAAEKAAAAKRPVFRVQIFVSTTKLEAGDFNFKGLKGCKFTKPNKLYKYTYGETTDYQKILQIQKELKAKFPDCFIVAFKEGKEISVTEARNYKK